MKNSKFKIWSGLLLCCLLHSAFFILPSPAQPVPPSTAFTRYLLTSTNQAQFQERAGVTAGGATNLAAGVVINPADASQLTNANASALASGTIPPARIGDGSITTNKVDPAFHAWVEAQSATGISDSTATNIAAYQALIVSNGVSARMIATNNALVNRITDATNVLYATMSARINAIRTNTFNVVDYGADPRGVLMSDLAFQAAINDAQTNGGVVLAPPGLYSFSTNQADLTYLAEGHPSILTIRSNNIVIRGSGKDRTRFVVATNTPTQWNLIGSLNVTNVALEDFTLDAGDHINIVDMTQFYYQDNVWFKNIRFQNVSLGDAVDVQQGGIVFVEGCEFYNIAGNCFSTQDALMVIRNCYGRGSGWDLEFRSRDSVQAPASVLQSYSTQTRMSECVFENFSVLLDQYSGTVSIENSYFTPTNTSAFTNVWIGGGTLKLNNVSIASAANFTTGHLIAVNTNGFLEINGGSFDGKRQIYANQPAAGGIQVKGAKFGSITLNNGPAITLNGGNGALISGCHFYGNDYRAVDIEGALPFHNVIVQGGYFSGMGVQVNSSASTNCIVDGVYFLESSPGFWAGTNHVFRNNTMVGKTFNMGFSRDCVIENNYLPSITISSAQPTLFRNNKLINPTIIATADQINNARWEGNTTVLSLPLRSTVLTANYTNDAIDTVVVFNGANLTNTIPSAVTLNNRKQFTIKNLHATDLEVTNATGAQTFDGALRFSLPQYASKTIVSDGANWLTVADGGGTSSGSGGFLRVTNAVGYGATFYGVNLPGSNYVATLFADTFVTPVSYRVPLKAVSVNGTVAMTSDSPFSYADSMRFATNGSVSMHFPPQNHAVSNYVLRTVWQASAAGSYPQTLPLEYYVNYYVNTTGRIFNQNHVTTNLVFTAANTLLTNTVALNTGTNVMKEFAIQLLSQAPASGPNYLFLLECIVTEMPNAQ
jgi:hypothetical protein